MDFNLSEIIGKLLVDLEESWQLPSRFYVKNLQMGMVISFEYGIYGKTINGWSVVRVVCRTTALVGFSLFCFLGTFLHFAYKSNKKSF